MKQFVFFNANKWRASLVVFAFIAFGNIGAFSQVTEIITDYGGYWKSGRPVVNTVRPDNSHNLLGFKYSGNYYSTGINDGVLTSHGISFNPGDYRALPIASSANPINGTFIGLGQLYDGVDNGPSNPAPVNNIPFYLTDGVKGLNLGTAVYNIPASNLSFSVSNFQIPKIGDGIPDIIITQMGEVGTATADVLSFRNSAGVIVGNSVSVNLGGLDSLGLGVYDFYRADLTPMTIATGGNFTKSPRAIRFFAADLSVFGLNSSNVLTVSNFVQQLNGTSDVAFVAYNAEAIKIVPDNIPGCSSLPGLWLKANTGTSTITSDSKIESWGDQSQNAFSMTQIADALRPKFKNGQNLGFNFNPYINFDNQNIMVSANSPFDAITNNADFFIVGRPTNTATGKNKILGFSRSAADVGTVNQGDFPELSYNEAGKSVIDNAISTNPLAGTSSSLNTTYLWQTGYTQGGTISLFKNGVADGAGGTPANIGRQSFQIGDASPGNNLSDFDVAEIISFAKNLTPLERNKVETYLGIKYGLTLSHDYISGAGATIWSLASSTAYNNNIFGIGREDCQGLYQKQSKSGNANALVTIGNLSIANENSLNFSAMNNAAYSVMGDDNGGLAWQTTEKPAKIEKRVAREWKVVETNTVGNILLSVPSAASSLSVKLPDPGNCKMYLLVDNDGDFSSGIIAQIPMTLNETNWEATYNFASGNYYTFATENRDYGDFPTTWPLAAASVNGCDVNNNGEYSNNDNNGTKVLVWAGNAVTSEQNAFTNDDDADDDGLIFPSAVFLPGATYNFSVLLNSNIPNTTVYYRVWFDWDNNGSFSNDNDGNGSPATFAGSSVVAGTAAKQVTFSVKLPAAASQLSKMRLIVSDAAIADLYRPASSPAYQFFLTNGEVEDYSAPLSVLPVKLGKFEVAVKNCSASLSWQTLSEENLKQFEIQFSTDGQNFDNLATILAKDIPSGASYNALAAISEGNNYFRLKMLNGDGSYSYSSVRYVKSICKKQKIVISPNPVQNQLLVSGLVKNSVLIISDATGRVVLQEKTDESTSRQINTQQLPVGFYTLRVVGNNVQAGAYKFLKTK